VLLVPAPHLRLLLGQLLFLQLQLLLPLSEFLLFAFLLSLKVIQLALPSFSLQLLLPLLLFAFLLRLEFIQLTLLSFSLPLLLLILLLLLFKFLLLLLPFFLLLFLNLFPVRPLGTPGAVSAPLGGASV
jgi:hypothetical protein